MKLNNWHLLVVVTGLGLLLGVTPSWGQTPTCASSPASPGCNPTASDDASNTAGGTDALVNNMPGPNEAGAFNSAFGEGALGANTTGIGNTATGFTALNANTIGNGNTATGIKALLFNVNGCGNTASGSGALQANISGNSNTAIGDNALNNNASGSNNTAFGAGALNNSSDTTGINNIALGFNAGAGLTAGNNDIYIGNTGGGAENRTIRLGTQGLQVRTIIAGISGTNVAGGTDVVVSSSGQLGDRGVLGPLQA